jgi:hypothetical protein
MQRPFRQQQGEAVAFSLSFKHPCPCDSGRRLKRCCWDPQTKTIHTRAATVTPRGPKTGKVVAGCYAAPLQDCDGKLTREHPISEGILRRLNSPSAAFGVPAGVMRVVNYPGLPPGEPKSLPPTELTMRVLCERHNHTLSGLDTVANRLFAAIDENAEEFKAHPDRSIPRIYLFNGHDIERWLLKVLGALTTRSEGMFPDRPTVADFPLAWLEILFGIRDFEPGQGLYMPRTVGMSRETERGIALGGIGQEGHMVGLTADLRGESFNLIMTPRSDNARHFLGAEHAYRPLEIHVSDGISEKSIVFSWDGPADRGTIHMTNRNLSHTVGPGGPRGK